MKCNQLITAALLSLGLISAASASSTATIGGTTYTVVYVTGSTAFRANVYTAVNCYGFDSTPTYQVASGSVSGSTGVYNAYGTIGGAPYLLSFDFTGSEAGIAALENLSTGIPNAYNNGLGNNPSAVLPGTPLPQGFVNPNNVTATVSGIVPDLALADTSQAVSLSATKPALTDYGIVGIIPFEWVKGKNSTGSSFSSWNDLTNVTQPQLTYELAVAQKASFFTGYPADTAKVYLFGRNKGSGTRVNTLLDTYYGVNVGVIQYAVTASTSYSAGALTFGSATAITGLSSLTKVGNDGFDSGSGVAKSLTCDTTGSGLVTLGYAGISDATGTAIPGGAVALSLDGIYESDASVISGAYSFWGHEHLYGTPSQSTSSPGGFVANKLTGFIANGVNEGLGANSTAAGALENSFGTGGGRETTGLTTTQSTAIDPTVMLADKPSDSGYPSQQ